MTRAQATAGPLHVINLAGQVVGTVPVATDGSATTGVGPHHIWVTENSSLTFYGANGAKLATDAYSPASFSSAPVFSADGSHWVWSYSPDQVNAQGGTSTIYTGTQASQMTMIATQAEGMGMRLTPIAWVGAKVYLTEYTVIGGGRIVFGVGTGAWSLDTSSGALAQLDASCHLQDVASDGSLLCLQGQTLTVTHPGGGTTNLTFSGAWDQAGAARFSPDGRTIIVSAVAFQASTSTGATFKGDATGGNMTKVADDAFGAYFLPDGRFLALTPTGWVVETQDGAKMPVPLPAAETVLYVLTAPAD